MKSLVVTTKSNQLRSGSVTLLFIKKNFMLFFLQSGRFDIYNETEIMLNVNINVFDAVNKL